MGAVQTIALVVLILIVASLIAGAIMIFSESERLRILIVYVFSVIGILCFIAFLTWLALVALGVL